MATYYVRASGGSDVADGLSFANAWATIQFMADTMVAGDTGLVCADGVHLPAATVNLDTNAGTFVNPISWRGASATGDDDGTVATISGDDSLIVIFDDGVANSTSFVHFEGLRITGATVFNVRIDLTQRGLVFDRCRIDGSGAVGVNIATANADISFVNCEIDDNVTDGVGQSSVGRGVCFFANCSIHDNGGHGIELGHIIQVQYCWIFKNGGDGIRLQGSSSLMFITNNVIDDNTGDGISGIVTNDLARFVITNNIITNNGGWGITFDGNGFQGIRGSNVYFNNALGEVSFDGISEDTLVDFETIAGSVISDPLYNNTGDGTEDYRVDSDSPAFAVAYPQIFNEGGVDNFATIGSNTPEAVGSGGGKPCIIGGGGL